MIIAVGALSWPLADALRGFSGWSLSTLAKLPVESAQAYQRSPLQPASQESATEEVDEEESPGLAVETEVGDDGEDAGRPGAETKLSGAGGGPRASRKLKVSQKRPTALIHIGPAKTGTTYIQQVLWRYKDALLDRNIVYFVPPVKKGVQFKPAHHFLSYPADGSIRMIAFKAKVSEALAKGQHMIVSSETLANMHSNTIPKLIDIFRSFDIKVVFTHRGFLSRTWSAYKQHLFTKDRGTEGVSYAQYMGKISNRWGSSVGIADKYGTSVGRKNIVILDFLSARSEGDIVNVMLSAVGLPAFQKPFGKIRVSKGVTNDTVIYYQMFNLLEEYMLDRHDCTLMRRDLVDKVKGMFRDDAMPKKCLDMEPLKRRSIEIDALSREKLRDRIYHGRPELTETDTKQFEQICEIDYQTVRKQSTQLFEKQAAALLHDACEGNGKATAKGNGQRPKATAKGAKGKAKGKAAGKSAAKGKAKSKAKAKKR